MKISSTELAKHTIKTHLLSQETFIDHIINKYAALVAKRGWVETKPISETDVEQMLFAI